MAEKMTRRTFMKSAAAAAAAISLSGVLVGCGGGSVAADEVKLGAYTVKLYSANTHAEVQGTGGSSYKITAKADITFDKLMRDLIKYEYIEDDANIPENQFGLGYTNLVMIIAAIMDYMERYPDSSFNSKINLISIEEPETFMHPQMQELFIKNINEAIRVLLSSKNKDVNSQIIITTHSSHILNSKIHSNNTFNNICYLYEDKRNAAVANLNNKIVMPNEHEDEESEAFKFLKKHIKYKVSELFFSDAAIFVEGFAEDMIIPYYIEKMEGLRKHYISIFNINGAHGFLYKRLIEALGIPVLIITDLDIKRNEESDEADKQEGKKDKNI